MIKGTRFLELVLWLRPCKDFPDHVSFYLPYSTGIWFSRNLWDKWRRGFSLYADYEVS